MVNTMFVLDRTLNTSHILSANKNSQSAFWEDTYTQEFDTGAESFEFSCYTHESIKEGNYVAFFYNNQYKMFQIIEVQEVHKKGRLVSECYCEIASLQLLNNYVKPFSGDMNCIQFFQHILHGTEWHIGKYSTSLENVVYTVNEKNIESVWSLIEDYKDIYGCEINVRVTYDNGHVTGQYIDIYAEGGLGSSTFKRFEYGVNVTGITKTKDLYDWCTGIILDVECDVSDTVIEERDGYGFTKGAGDVILDNNANRMYNAGRTHVIGVYQGNETEPVEACINAWKELQKRKEPKFDYKVTTALKDEEYEDIHLGDTVYVVDHSYTPPLLLEARVGKLELSFTDRTQNSCTLTNYKEIKSKLLDADYIKLTGTITDVVNAFFPITSEGIADGAIVDGKIETTYFQQITSDIVSAGIGAFENLYVQGMTVINADIESLRADTAEITQLKSQLADIDTLINGHLTSDNIQSMVITGDKFTVADGFIKNAMIDNITADKITTGSINTDNVYISSEDGSMIINGSLQQFKDKDGNVRIQIGKDAQGDFTFSLFDESGTGVLIDEKGITENAIADGLIVNDMVAENAGIAGSKLDIDSVVTEINNGTSTIKGTKVVLDDTNQTLDVAFNSLETKIDDIEIGGRNLVRNSDFSNEVTSWSGSNSSNIEYVTSVQAQEMTGVTVPKHITHIGKVTVASGQSTGYLHKYVELERNTQYTLSAWVFAPSTPPRLAVYFSSQNNGWEFVTNKIGTSNSWQKLELTFTTRDSERPHVICLGLATATEGDTCYVALVKLEKGTKATDWTPAIEDVDSKITSNTTAINVQQGQIDSLISNTTITKENGEVVQLKDEYNSTKNTVDSHTTKIGSLETTVNDVSSKQSSMELDLNGFRTEVSNTYVSKDGYVGINFIKNGRMTGAKALTHDVPEWIWWGSFEVYDYPQAYGDKFVCLRPQVVTTEALGGIFQPVWQDDIPRNTQVTLSYYISWEAQCNGAYIDITYYKNDTQVGTTYEINKGQSGYLTHTFTTQDIDYDYFRVGLVIYGLKTQAPGSFLVIFGNVKLELGSIATAWCENYTNYTTKTEFQQTTEDFTFKIQQAGGYNLLKNSSFTNGTEYWTQLCWDTNHSTNRQLYVMSAFREWNNNHFAGLEYSANLYEAQGYVRGGFDSPYVYNIDPGAKYSFSCYLACGRINEVCIELCGTNWNSEYVNWGVLWRGAVGNNTQWGTNYEGWTKIELTFTAPSDAYYIFLRFWGERHTEGDLATSLMISQPCLVRGSIPLDWSPHASEIYDGVVKIDSRGLSVQHANNKSVLDSEALKFYEGDELYSKVDGGLFKVMQPGDSSTTVGSMGRFRWVNSGTCCTCVSAGPGHDVAIGSVRTSGAAATCSLVDSSQGGYLTGTDFYYDQGLNINRATCHLLNFKGDKSASFSSQAETSVGALSLWSSVASSNSEGNSAQTGYIYSRDCLQFGIAYSALKCAMEICETANASNNTAIHMYGPISMHNYPIYDAQNISTLSARSSYTQTLLNRGSNDLYSYNNCSYYQGEIRWCWKEPVFTYAEADIDPITDEWVYTGRNICYIEIPPFIAENIEADYHIQVGKIGWGDYRILEKNQYYFILESQEEDFAFTFEVVAELVDSETLSNNVSISSMSTTANPAISVEPPTSEDIILPGSEDIWESAVVEDVEEEVIDNTQENINIGEE